MTNPALEAAARAMREAECPGREGPFGGYDYGHNTEFYGPAPKDGRYVIRDFRFPHSKGEWLHQTDDQAAHDAMFEKMTSEHIARAAIAAWGRNVVVSEAVWDGLPRDIMMWLDMEPKTPRALFRHLENCGREIPQWLRDEPEMKALDHVPSKGTRVVLIVRAALSQAADELEQDNG